MKKDTSSRTPTFPRKQVIERQAERTRKVLQLSTETLDLIRVSGALYGAPPNPDSRDPRFPCES
jgi:hypothetical protein